MVPATFLVFAAVLAQSLLAPKPSAIQHVRAAPTVTRTAAGQAMLALDVDPNPGIHVYAAGAKDFTPVALVLTPRDGVRPGKATYPKADPVPVAGGDPAPAYRKAFRIEQPVTITAPKGSEVVIAGVLNYQSCDERVCYPVASLPVSWKVKN